MVESQSDGTLHAEPTRPEAMHWFNVVLPAVRSHLAEPETHWLLPTQPVPQPDPLHL